MMKKEMIFPSPSVPSGPCTCSRSSLRASFRNYCLHNGAVLSLASFYSRLLETSVTPSQTLHLLHAQAAFFLLVFPFPVLPFVRLLFLCWAALAVVQCRRAGLR